MAKEANKKSKDKKNFGKDFRAELKRVVWPTPKELFRSTLAVIVIVIVIVAIVFCLDFVFESMNKYGIDKIKEAVTTSDNSTTEGENTENTESTENNETTSEGEETNTAETNQAAE